MEVVSERDSAPGERRSNLGEVMGVVRGDLVELVFQGAHACVAMDELSIAMAQVVAVCIVDHTRANGLIDVSRELEWQVAVVEARGKGILIERPQDLARLTDDSPNAIEENGFGIGEVVQQKPDGPFAGRVGQGERVRVEGVEAQRLVACLFELLDELHNS